MDNKACLGCVFKLLGESSLEERKLRLVRHHGHTQLLLVGSKMSYEAEIVKESSFPMAKGGFQTYQPRS
jgi:hypothetical protein